MNEIIKNKFLPNVIYANRLLKHLNDSIGKLVITDKKLTMLSTAYPLIIIFPYEYNNFKYQAKYTETISGEGDSIEEAISNLIKKVKLLVIFNYDENVEKYKSYEFWNKQS